MLDPEVRAVACSPVRTAVEVLADRPRAVPGDRPTAVEVRGDAPGRARGGLRAAAPTGDVRPPRPAAPTGPPRRAA